MSCESSTRIETLRQSISRIKARIRGTQLADPPSLPVEERALLEGSQIESQHDSVLPQPSNSIAQESLNTSVTAASFRVSISAAGEIMGVELGELETALNVLPLVSGVIGGLRQCLAQVQAGEKHRVQYENELLKLARHARRFKEWVERSKVDDIRRQVEITTVSIKNSVMSIKILQEQHKAAGTMDPLGTSLIIPFFHQIIVYFNQLQVVTSGPYSEKRMGVLLERLFPICGAQYGVQTALPRGIRHRTCLPNTSTQILSDVLNWSANARGKNLFYMRGITGTGKTTVAYTVCKQLDNEKRLGASFFCSRNSPGRRDVNRIMPTIAYQLARLSGEYWDELFLALNNRIDAAKLTLEEQFQEWIVRPLLKARHTVPTDTIIVIDALDECLDSYGARDILNLLSKYPGKLPIKFFLTCNHLTEGNDVRQRIPQDRFRMALQVYDIENSIGRTDIKSYLSGELASMQLPSGDIGALCALAGRQFIFAVVAARYVPSGASITDNLRRLSIVLNLGADSGDNTRTKMDDLYFSILSDTPDGTDLKQEEVVMRRQVLQTLTYMSEPVTTNLLVGLLDLENQHSLHLILEPLRPLLYLNSTTGVISIRHASFAEFLFDPMRSGRFHSSEKEHHEQMAARCFQLMHQLLRFNICGLEGPAQVDKDVLDLLARVEKVVPPALFYACRNWGVHLQRSEQLSNLIPCLNDFFQHKLLFWMEVMNLKGCINHGATVLLQAQDWLSAQVKANHQLKQDETVRKDHVGIKLLKFSQDAHKFIRAYAGSPMSLSTPHIYLSALPSLSTKNPIYKAYRPQMNDNLIELRGPGMKGRRIAPISEWSTGAMVNCLALSTDGTRIAAGLHNGKVGIWNTDGKPLIKPQSVGKGPVNVVAFSPDGRDVASGYERDSTIHIWNTKSGKGAQILALNEQHQCNRTNSISFSPDGARFVSASDGTKIYVWDMRAGRTVGGILERHQKAVTSVLFFHDNRRIASASDDCTIFIWDSLTGEVECGPFEGHTEGILSIGLSPDNTHLVSGGRDYTIRVWDVASGMLHAGPFESHTMDITSVAFSPNGRQIVSGSWDKTVRIWDSGNGKQPSGPYIMNSCWPNCAVFALDGSHVISGSGNRGVCKWSLENNTTSNKIYSNSVIISSVATSPDGSRVVAGFWDGTISIWDAQDGSLIIGPRQEHNAAIMSVSWSPNGKYIATASADCTVCFWDVDTQSIARLCPKKGHAGPVLCVSFSPDNTHAVSGSQDSTIKTWILQLRDDSSKLQFFEARLIESHTSAVHSVTFSFDSLQIVSASSDQTVRLWSAYTGRLLMVFRGHNTEVMTAAISTDGQKIISGATDGTIIAWDVDSGLPHANLPFKGHTASIRSISFSLDNTLVVSGSDDGAVSLWDARSGMILIPPIREHSDKVSFVGFSPNRKHIISGSEDGSIRFWDTSEVLKGQHSITNGWTVHNDGWVKDSTSQLILWLPLQFREIFPKSPCSLIIRRDGYISVNGHYPNNWRSWADCYKGQVGPDRT